MRKRVEKGRITQQQLDEVVSRFKGTASYEDLKGCDLVMEATQEEIEKEINIFENLAQVCSSDTIFVSNTSTILIYDIMATIARPQRTAGLYYFFPAHINPLVEVIRELKQIILFLDGH